MGADTKIEWCDHTFNPWQGCSKIAAGCKSCYAESIVRRFNKAAWGPQGTRVKTSEAYWRQPLKWNREAARQAERDSICAVEHHRPRVFCASLADVFEDWQGPIVDAKGNVLGVEEDWSDAKMMLPGGGWVPATTTAMRKATMDDVRRDLFSLIDATPNLDWLILTKRPENVRRMADDWCRYQEGRESPRGAIHFPRNTWLGTSIATQADADKNVPELLKCRDLSPVLFLSCEPLLEAVDLEVPWEGEPTLPTVQVDWIIAGGESGPSARPCNLAWIRSLVEQCKAATVPVFTKQIGTVLARELRSSDKKGGCMDDWPTDIQIRELPQCHTLT